METVRRAAPSPHAGRPELGLGPTQIYPEGRHLLPVLEQSLVSKLQQLQLGRATACASIGTCFAEEFAHFVCRRGYRYVVTEPNLFAASANWGRVYTVPNLLQVLRYSFEDDFTMWVERTDRGYFDPLREHEPMPCDSRPDALALIAKHRHASRSAFLEAEVLIVTVGQNEAWVDGRTGMVWARMPPSHIMAERRADFAPCEFPFERVRDDLLRAITLLRQHNPRLRILFTVSPVAAYASFSDSDVVSQSFANKCLLRTAVHDVVKQRRDCAFYFPSFEIVLCDNAANFRADNRHVKHSTVHRIFDLFARTIQPPRSGPGGWS